MQISGNTFPLTQGAGLQIRSFGAIAPIRSGSSSGATLRDFAKSVLGLRGAHKALAFDGRHFRINGTRQGAATGSASLLTLSTAESQTTLRSTEEVNTTPTSYSTTSPAFSGGSTTAPTIGGVYSGANGDTTLTFTATFGGVVGTTPVTVEVRDSENNLIDTIAHGFDAPGTVYTLSNGLEVSFSAGNADFNDTFQVDVFASVGSEVRRDNAFDGTGDAAPEFDPGVSVNAGSFDVNGVSIAVAANDTVNTILSRITASASGVTATFDTETESIVLTQNAAGSDSDIVVDNDTSGFLAATKLGAATSVLGSFDERNELIEDVDALSGIQSGTFTINGVEFTVDISQDSLLDVISRINNSSAGAVGSFNVAAGRVSLQATGTESLVLQDGTSGFLSSLDIDDGTFEGKNARSKTRFRDANGLRDSLGDFVRAYADVFQDSIGGYGASTATSIRGQLNGDVAGAFKEYVEKSGTGTLRSGLGLDFVNESGEYRTLDLDSARLGRVLKRNGEELAEFLFAEAEGSDVAGLVTAIGDRLEGVIRTLEAVLGSDFVGLGIDVSA